jgi:hypothetical protein
MMRALCDAFNMDTEKLKSVSGLLERIDTMATRLPQPTTSSADYIQDVERGCERQPVGEERTCKQR